MHDVSWATIVSWFIRVVGIVLMLAGDPPLWAWGMVTVIYGFAWGLTVELERRLREG